MTGSADAIAAVIESGRGARPYSLRNQEAEQVLNIALSLMVELAASNDRIDRLERLLAETRGEPLDDLRNALPDGDAASERQAALEAMQMRVMRVLIDPREAVAVEFLFGAGEGEAVRRAYVEVGDFAAGRAFLQVASR